MLDLLEALVAMPTVAGRPNQELTTYVSQRLAARGIASTTFASHTRADGLNLHATVGPPVDGGVLLAAHTDVVATDGQPWSSDPFRLRRAGERLHGRGTADMKGFVAAAVLAVERAATRPLRRPLGLALSCDEELGCAGVGSLLDLLAAAPERPALVIVGEPTGLRVADRHKGKVRLRVDIRGRAAHSATAPDGVNAVSFAARLINALDDLGRALAGGARDEAFSVPHATLSVGPIRGGISTNIVPDKCSFEFELRHLPGQERDPILALARDLAAGLANEMRETAPEARIAFHELAAYPPLDSASDALAAVLPLLDEPGEVAAPRPAPARTLIAVDFGTEAGLYSERLGVPVVVCGPGDMARAHRADEYIQSSELDAAQRLLDRVTDSLCEA